MEKFFPEIMIRKIEEEIKSGNIQKLREENKCILSHKLFDILEQKIEIENDHFKSDQEKFILVEQCNKIAINIIEFGRFYIDLTKCNSTKKEFLLSMLRDRQEQELLQLKREQILGCIADGF